MPGTSIVQKLQIKPNRDGIASYAKTIGMQAVAQIAIDENWSALRLNIV